MARNAKPAEDRRSVRVLVRFTPAEARALRVAATDAGRSAAGLVWYWAHRQLRDDVVRRATTASRTKRGPR